MTSLHSFLAIDMPALLAASLCGMSASMVGAILHYRRVLLMGDALSHSVLPGIVISFAITHMVSPPMMVTGALIAALITVWLITWLDHITPLSTHSLMAIILTSMFALGVTLLERLDLSGLHIDIQHALFGNLSAIIAPTWMEGTGMTLARWTDMLSLPIRFLAFSFLCVASFVFTFRKELALLCFDEDYAKSIGYNAPFLRYGFAFILALTLVSAFQAVGAVLIITLLTCPILTASLLSMRLIPQMVLAILLSLLAVFCGYTIAVITSLNAAAVIALTSAIQYGVVTLYVNARKRA
ncbi:MAG: metal ABC transporter permease [Alphaproteobacteria bacterium GM7ARS4]|nr:metal ABC transporter permease [Alphaproteobacteria bacterium GM7ARS4]